MFEFTHEKINKNTVLFTLSKDMVEEHDGNYVFMCIFKELIEKGIVYYDNNFIFDLRKATSIHEHLLKALIWIIKKTHYYNKMMIIITDKEQINKLFIRTGFSKLIHITQNPKKALKIIKSNQPLQT